MSHAHGYLGGVTITAVSFLGISDGGNGATAFTTMEDGCNDFTVEDHHLAKMDL